MNTLTKFAFVLLSVAVVSCAPTRSAGLPEVPVPVNFSTEAQHKLQSLSHLNNVAEDMADSVLKKYASGGGCIPGQRCNLSIFVRNPNIDTKYSRAFHSQFVSALVNRGMVVLSQRTASVEAEIDMQVFKFRGLEQEASFCEKNPCSSCATEVGNGVWVIRDLNDTSVHKFSSLSISVAECGDTNSKKWFYSPHTTPTTEMLITVSFIKDGQYMARTSNVYYVDLREKEEEKTVVAPEIHVIGDCPDNRCIK